MRGWKTCSTRNTRRSTPSERWAVPSMPAFVRGFDERREHPPSAATWLLRSLAAPSPSRGEAKKSVGDHCSLPVDNCFGGSGGGGGEGAAGDVAQSLRRPARADAGCADPDHIGVVPVARLGETVAHSG